VYARTASHRESHTCAAGNNCVVAVVPGQAAGVGPPSATSDRDGSTSRTSDRHAQSNTSRATGVPASTGPTVARSAPDTDAAVTVRSSATVRPSDEATASASSGRAKSLATEATGRTLTCDGPEVGSSWLNAVVYRARSASMRSAVTP
jgi:hypothetical protein